ncbi:MAG: hypothetical protein AAF546_05965 [Verrucomicrobiota bacterium]
MTVEHLNRAVPVQHKALRSRRPKRANRWCDPITLGTNFSKETTHRVISEYLLQAKQLT